MIAPSPRPLLPWDGGHHPCGHVLGDVDSAYSAGL